MREVQRRTAIDSARLVLREAEPSDALAIGEVTTLAWRAAYGEILPAALLSGLSAEGMAARWEALRASPAHLCTRVVAIDEQLVAVCSGGHPRDEARDGTAEVYALNVAPTHWRLRLGARLLLETEAQLARLGWERAKLWVLADNHRARSFYSKLGWSTSGKSRNHPRLGPPPVSEEQMVKELSERGGHLGNE